MEESGQVQREQSFYDERWSHSDLAPIEERRIAETLAELPVECQRLLDVGAGDGRLSRAAASQRAMVVAFDLSLTALSRLRLPRCCGSATRLPFADRSFDAAMATEILEHIPAPWYPQVLGEMARVADRFILITVPNRENLNEHTALCPSCGAHFHVWGHQRSYLAAGLEKLFPGFTPVRIREFGDRVDTYNAALLWLRHFVAGAWYSEDRAVCSRCLATERSQPRWPFGARVCDAVNARVWAPISQRHSWLLALYRRTGDPATGG